MWNNQLSLSLIFQPTERYLLPAVRNQDTDRKCVVIDLDETLVHSSFKVRTMLIVTWFSTVIFFFFFLTPRIVGAIFI